MQRIRIHRHRIRRERPWHDIVPPALRDPGVVRAKALARAGDRAGGRTARQSHSPGPAELRSYRPVTAARTIHPGGEPTRSKPRILVALLAASR
jgi:hypothetical protein